MSLEAKVDRALELLFKMDPMVAEIREAQKDAEARERVNDSKVTTHEVEIANLKDRVDGLHGKLNQVKDVPAETTRWGAIAEFLAALPAYWHFIGVGAAGLIGVVAFFARHHP